MSNSAAALDPYGHGETPETRRAQALRLVRHCFGPDTNPALAAAIAHWVVSGNITTVYDLVALDHEERAS